MNKILSLMAFILISFGGLMLLPWYTIIIIAAVFSFLGKYSGWLGIISFFLAGLILWSTYAYFLDREGASRLATRIGILFGNQKVITLILLTGFIGGVSSALGAWIGGSVNSYLNSK